MSISQFPQPTTDVNIDDSWSATASTPNTRFVSTYAFDPALYLFATSSGISVFIEFYNGNTRVHGPINTSGSTQTTLATSATSIAYWTATTSTSSVLFTLDKISAPLTTAAFTSGTVDIITSSTTYTSHTVGQMAYVIAFGGGGGGGFGNWGGGSGGRGQGGNSTSTITILNSNSYTVNIGAKGTGNSTTGGVGNAGGTTTFGNILTATGGSGGGSGIGGFGSGGSTFIVNDSYVPAINTNLPWYFAGSTSAVTGITATTSYPWGNGSGGEGQGGGGGRGVGIGGNSHASASPADRHSYGYASGGGGGPGYHNAGNQQGSDGSPGVVYVYRWTP